MNKDEILEIINKKSDLQGYAWTIDGKTPNLINGKFEYKTNENLEFDQIQEAYITDKANNFSLRVINSDGIEHWFYNKRVDFPEEENKFKFGDKLCYPSLDSKGIKNLYFQTVYQATESQSEGFKKWKPIFQFFNGIEFSKK